MSYWQGVGARLRIPSIILIVIGAVVCFGAQKLAPLVWKDSEKSEKMILPIKMAGLALAMIGALLAFV